MQHFSTAAVQVSCPDGHTGLSTGAQHNSVNTTDHCAIDFRPRQYFFCTSPTAAAPPLSVWGPDSCVTLSQHSSGHYSTHRTMRALPGESHTPRIIAVCYLHKITQWHSKRLRGCSGSSGRLRPYLNGLDWSHLRVPEGAILLSPQEL